VTRIEGSNADFDFGRFDVLTFDCYGTLIDWESGLLAALHAACPGGWPVDDKELLERFARHEAAVERGDYRTFREVLLESVQALARNHGVDLGEEAARRFSESVGDWPAFADSAKALRRLTQSFKLAVITNCDDDLFALSNERLGIRFDWIVTAQQVRSYKPNVANFERAFEVIGVPRDRILHVAQSLYHDHVPAKALGMTTVWIDRRHDREGFGATPPAHAKPDLVFPTMEAFAAAAVMLG
jgi:2-haloacid dehalogenase